MNILIVDDEQMAIEDLKRVLRKVIPDACLASADNIESAFQVFREKDWDVVFMDINMPGMTGIELVRNWSGYDPYVNFIMVTAYPQYALEAFEVYASGYILKPAMEEDVRKALDHLRNTGRKKEEEFHIRCFGNFEVYYKKEPVKFGRRQSKEMLAYLMDRMGASATSGEICGILWGDTGGDVKHQQNYLTKITGDLRKSLENIGKSDILAWSRNSYAVRFEDVQSDLRSAFEGDKQIIERYNGEYMSQYSWAEDRVPLLNDKFLLDNN